MGIGYVRFLMSDVVYAVEFFEGLGLVSEDEGGSICMRPRGGDCIIYIESKGELPREGNYVYHVAITLSSRSHLATLARLVDIEGVADHLVSESIYVEGPGGVGLEFYVDKLRDQWVVNDDGTIAMDVAPLDLAGLLRKPMVGNPMDGARIGHVHLRVSNVDVGKEFYSSLGLRITSKYMGAIFMALGDYHHHLTSNNWPVPAPRRGNGLLGFSIDYPDRETINKVMRSAGLTNNVVRDPYGFTVELRAP